MKRFLFASLGVVLMLAGPARAGIVFNLPATGQALGNSETYTSTTGGYKMAVTAYDSTLNTRTHPDSLTLDTHPKNPPDPYSGDGRTGEKDPGIWGSHNNYLSNNYAVEFNLTEAYRQGSRSVTLEIGGVQAGEGFAVFGGNPCGALSYIGQFTASCGSNTVPFPFVVTPAEMMKCGDILYVTATCHDVVVNSVTISSVPEPGTLAMMVTGLASVAGLGWQRRRKSA